MSLVTRSLAAGAGAALALTALTPPIANAQPIVGSGAAAVGGAKHSISVHWDWTMPTFMKDTRTFVPTNDKSDPDWAQGGSYVPGPDGIPDKAMAALDRYQNAGNAVYGKFPKKQKFAVDLDATASTGSGRLKCSWVIKEGGSEVKTRSNCAKKPRLKLTEGRHKMWLTVKDRSGRSNTIQSHIKVKNVLIAVLGDSYGSGEGFPPFTEPTADGSGRQVDWDYPSCNRSRWSGFVRAAQEVESADERSNVSLVDVACAGGEVDKGYIRQIKQVLPTPETEEIPTGGILYPKRRLKANGVQLKGYEKPQIDQVRVITRKAPLDSVLLSIGGNDAGLSDIGIACALEDFAKPNCYNEVPFFWDKEPNAQPLYEVIDQNLIDVKKRFKKMAPCFGASGTCKTTKLSGGQPAQQKSKSKSLTLFRPKNLVHAAYPDLTSTTGAGGVIEPCTNTPIPESPMNQIDNTWAYEGLYTGQAGRAYTLPENFSPPLPKPNPATITPDADGLVTLIKSNAKKFGWSPEVGVFKQSRGHGLCAGVDAWEYGLTSAQLAKNPANPAGALHPNDLGQSAYGEVLGERALKVTKVPVSKPTSTVLNGLG